MTQRTLSDETRQLVLQSGADLVGFADLSNLPQEYQTGYSHGISIAVALNSAVITEIMKGPTENYYQEYIRANALLDSIGITLSGFLREKGYRAEFSPATDSGIDSGNRTGITNMKTLTAGLSHKMIATRAGLGWIGKNDLLITREFGCAVRLNSVLTDASFPAGEPVNDSECGDCHACVDACPAQALSGKTWYPGIDRDKLVNVFQCRETACELTQKNFGKAVSICGVCIGVCPWTKTYLKAENR